MTTAVFSKDVVVIVENSAPDVTITSPGPQGVPGSNATGIASVGATDGTVIIGGTGTNPTVGVGVIPESKVTGLTGDLASKAATAHNHAGADVNSGTVAYARLPVGTTASTVAAGDDTRMTDSRTPVAHNHAGADVATGTVAYARLPVGSAASTVAAGDDTRMTNARTPTAHKATHATGGSDVLSPTDIGAAATAHNHAGADVTTGTVAYARLPVGTAASTVAAGDDSRLTDFRTPVAHNHAGADVATGTVAYARLPVGTAASTVAAGDDTRMTDSRTPNLTATTDNMIQSVAGAWASRTPAQVKTALAIAESDVTGLVTDLAAKQPLDSDLTTIAALTATTDNILQSVAGAWASRTPAQVKAALIIAEADVAGLVTDLAAKQPLDSDLTTIAGLTATTDNILQSVAGAWASRTPAQVKTALAIAESDVTGLVADIAVLHRSITSGLYYFTSSPNGSSTSGSLANGNLRVLPWIVTKQITITRIGAEVTVVGDAGSKLRLGIYSDNGSCYPGALLLDAGQIAGDSATVQELTVNQVIAPGLYWIGGAIQSVTTTQPTLRTGTVSSPLIPLSVGSTIPAAAASTTGYNNTGITAALPANFTATVTTAGSSPRVFVKA